MKIQSVKTNKLMDKKYQPETHVPEDVVVKISGGNVAYMNSVRRALNCEIPVLALAFDYDDFHSNDDFVLFDYIQRNVRMIPIDQSEDRKFHLHKRAGEEITTVYSQDIVDDKGKPVAANGSIIIMRLNPRCYVKISNIRAEYNYGERDGSHVLAFSTVSKPEELRFTTNGNAQPERIIKQAGDSIVSRLQSLRALLSQYEYRDGVYILHVFNENSTVGNALVQATYDLYDNITITAMNNTEQQVLTIRVVTNDNYEKIMNRVIDHLVDKVFGTLIGHINQTAS